MAELRKLLYSEVSPLASGEPFKIGDWRKLPEIVHDDHNIKGFFGEYRWLSNFGAAIVMLDGVQYGGVEPAYQAAKWRPEHREYFATCTNNEAITYNRDRNPDLYISNEWDVAKLGVMRFLLEQKFNPELNPDNAQKLVETQGRYLEETNWWNDTFWGKNLAGEGQNNLGRLIMEIRAELVEE
jgi:predicted NAD-dependent protein-ADP-ribosyltransferase YbiA (DUF1768 family)